MELYRIVADVMDFRSFSNMWYWIAVAVMWSVSSNRVLGVPYDMIQRARRQGGPWLQDVEDLAAINARRLLYLSRSAAIPLFFSVTFILSVVMGLGFWYRIEIAQALCFLLFPLLGVGWCSLHTASRVEAADARQDQLLARLLRHRRQVQLIGICAIFVTALYGMWYNLNYSVLN